MGNFLKLKDSRGFENYINFDLVTIFYSSKADGLTTIVFDENYLEKVVESPEEIIKMLEE